MTKKELRRLIKEEVKKMLLKEDREFKVKLLPNVREHNASDMEMSSIEYKKLVRHIGERGHATLSVDQDSWEDNYYNVYFPDGFDVESISGYHLKKL